MRLGAGELVLIIERDQTYSEGSLVGELRELKQGDMGQFEDKLSIL